jgi:hypothetical protein
VRIRNLLYVREWPSLIRLPRMRLRRRGERGRRFERCLSEDVLADTIVKRKFPGTGDPFPLLVLGLGAVALGAAVGIVILRRS